MALQASRIPELAFEGSSFAQVPKFPGIRFRAHADFADFRNAQQELLDARYGYEQSMAVSEPSLVQNGTCAPCLRAAVFTSGMEGGEALRDGTCVPHWRGAMQCDCKDRLNARQRMLVHLTQASGVLPWMRLLLAGLPEAMDAKLQTMVQDVVRMRSFTALSEAGSIHYVVSNDYLQHIPQLHEALKRICGALTEGGRFIFTIPFHWHEEKSELMDLSPFQGRVPDAYFEASHKLGWDILDRLRDAGFRDAAAYLYWSEELGYLGPMNFVFRAVK